MGTTMYNYKTIEIELILNKYNKLMQEFMNNHSKDSIELSMKEGLRLYKLFYKEIKAIGGYKTACFSLGSIKPDVVIIGTCDTRMIMTFSIHSAKKGIFTSQVESVQNLYKVQSEEDAKLYNIKKNKFDIVEEFQKRRYKYGR